MKNRPVKAGFLPLYLQLYESISPGYYETYTPFLSSITGVIEDNGIIPVSPGVVFTEDHVENARQLFENEGISMIIMVHLSYSPSFLIADFLEDTNLPILSIDTTPDHSFENMESEYLTRNHGIHGVMDLTSVLKSRGVNYAVVSGFLEDNSFKNRLKTKLNAMKAAALYRNQRIGLTGLPFAGMGDFAVDFDVLKQDFGIEVKDIPPQLLFDESRKISDKDIDAVIQEDASFWDTSGITDEAHREAARSYLALRNILEEEDCTGYTMNFQHVTEGMATPFYACSRIISEGFGYGGEGDVLTASLGYPLNHLSRAAKFDEFFCADWKNDRILMSHMGESDARFVKKDSAPYLTVRDGFVNPRDSVIYRYRAEPGEVTFVNLCPTAGGYRMVTGLLDIEDAEILDEIKAPHYQVHTRMSVGRFLERYAEEGGGHHLYIAYGNIKEELETFARTLGFEYNTITQE